MILATCRWDAKGGWVIAVARDTGTADSSMRNPYISHWLEAKVTCEPLARRSAHFHHCGGMLAAVKAWRPPPIIPGLREVAAIATEIGKFQKYEIKILVGGTTSCTSKDMA